MVNKEMKGPVQTNSDELRPRGQLRGALLKNWPLVLESLEDF